MKIFAVHQKQQTGDTCQRKHDRQHLYTEPGANRGEIRTVQNPHLPDKKIKLAIGIFWWKRNGVRQAVQREPGRNRPGTSARSPLASWPSNKAGNRNDTRLTKLPRQAPRANKSGNQVTVELSRKCFYGLPDRACPRLDRGALCLPGGTTGDVVTIAVDD